ncbi:MAG: caspase family protein [Myxococcota bacterium]
MITANQGKLRGCDDDGHALSRCLPDFEPWSCAAATRSTIAAAFERLEHTLRPEAALVVYLSGHGGWARFRGQPSSAGATEWPFFVTADQGTGDRFTSVLAVELSALVGRCVRRTRNVTVIVDTCFAPELVRGGASIKSFGRHEFARPDWLGHVEARCTADRRERSLVDEHIVCVNAAGAEQPAYEAEGRDGRRGGAFTHELCELIKHARARRVSWRLLVSVIARRLAQRWGEAFQQPVVSGPDTRRLFLLARAEHGASVRVTAGAGGSLWLGCGALHGADVGDRFIAHDGTKFVELELMDVRGNCSRARSDGGIPEDGGLAFPVARTRKLSVEFALSDPVRRQLIQALSTARHLQIRASDQAPDLCVRDDTPALSIESGTGELLLSSSRANVLEDLDGLTRARLFEDACAGGSGWRHEWTLAVFIERGGTRSPLHDGMRACVGDRMWVEASNRSACDIPKLYLNLVERGVDGMLRVLHAAHFPSGVPIRAGTMRRLLWYPDGPHGHCLRWPGNVPRDRPRTLCWFFVATALPLDLRTLDRTSARPSSLLRPRRAALASSALTPVPVATAALTVPSMCWSVRRFNFVVEDRPAR